MPRKITCKPHPMSGESEGPVINAPDNAPIDLPMGGTKNAVDIQPGDRISTYSNGPAFEVLTNVDNPEV
jgi:hypothetical protein